MEEVVERLRGLLSEQETPGGVVPSLPSEDYEAVPFSDENFKRLSLGPTGEAAFVDGGNAELVVSASFCLSFVRVFGVVYSGKERKSQKLQECMVLVKASGEGEDLVYTAELFPLRGDPELPPEDLRFDSMDETLRSGIRRSSVTSVVGAARRFLELKLAKELGSSLGGDGVVVVDGNLQQTYTHEGSYLSGLKSLDCPVVGLSKTSTVFTTSGGSFNATLMREGPHERWWYHPVGKPKKVVPDISFVKFHRKAKYVFMVESFSGMDGRWLSVLALQCSDPVFLGYPYGLVYADRMARVSNQEMSYLRTKLVHSLGPKQKELERHLNTVNAHDVLDGRPFH